MGQGEGERAKEGDDEEEEEEEEAEMLDEYQLWTFLCELFKAVKSSVTKAMVKTIFKSCKTCL